MDDWTVVSSYGEFGYHAAPAAARDSIMRWGLRPGPSRGYPKGVYVFPTREDAEKYAEDMKWLHAQSGRDVPYDIWEVPLGEANLKPDPLAPGGVYSPRSIKNVRLAYQGWGGDAYPAEEPQAKADRDYTDAAKPANPVHKNTWAIHDGEVVLGDEATTADAKGIMDIENNWHVTFKVMNTSLPVKELGAKLRSWAGANGYEFKQLQDAVGNVIPFGRSAAVPGIGERNPGVMDWRQRGDEGGWSDDSFQRPKSNLFGTGEGHVCRDCGERFADSREWFVHRLYGHGAPPTPVVDLDQPLPANYNEGGRMNEPGITAAAPVIPGPIPWLYDIKGDQIYVGHPGDAPEELHGTDYNPMGVVEGVYTPKGEMQLVEVSNMPVTVRHLIRLWYYMYPELEVKRVLLNYTDLDGKPKKRRLAAEGIHGAMNNALANDPAAFHAAQALMPHGNVYVVGGAIRDLALGQNPKDVDLMASGIHPQRLENILGSLPGRVDFTGKTFGVYRYRTPEGRDVEIALPRTETSTGEGHKDFDVKTDYRLPVEADLNRRDFTGNAMAYDIARQQLIDPHGGWNDLQDRRLRVVNEHAFRDDPLRILRGLASVSRHGLHPDEHTRNEMRLNAPNLKHLPQERIQAELDKLMGGKNPAGAMRLAQETGVLEHFLPEVANTHGFDQRNRHHDRELFDHIIEVLEHMTKLTDDKDLRYTALLHDIGKPASQWINPDGFAHYYRGPDGQGNDHEVVGANMAEEALRRLKFPRNRIERIKHLVHHHMFPEFQTESGARKFMNRVGPDHADDLLHMRAADLTGKVHGGRNVDAMRDLLDSVRAKGEAVTQSNLAINGKDLITMGMPPGPQMGSLLKYLTDLVLENPELNDRARLMAIAQEHI